jgi:mannan endo-1,4-beta-mannosidase
MKCTLIIAVAILLLAAPAPAQVYRYQAESGTYGGASFANSTPGYSGTGYITFNNNSTDSFVQVSAPVPQGLYELWIGYNSPFGFKGYDYQVNGAGGSGGFDGNGNQFGEDRAGVFHLTQPSNTLRINRGWGWYNVDYFELRPFTPPAIQPIAPQLTDELADSNTQTLMNYLTGIYGQQTLAGHQHKSSQNLAFPSSTYLSLSGGLRPAIRSSDFIEYSPSRIAFGANPRNESEQSIAWAKANGGVISMTWHWNAPANLVNSGDWPWWRGFYTEGTTFDLAGALANPAGSDYQLILRDIDAIAVQLQKFENAGVPVIWRPLHEAQGNADGTSGSGAWFWWGAHGPGPFKELWRLMYDRLTNYHGLHNLIWEFTSSAAKDGHLEWYPGDDVVDMVGLDIYTDPTSSMSGEWYDVLAHYNGRKMIALSETGTLPNADSMDLYGNQWNYFSVWTDDYLDDFPASQVQTLLSDEDIITLNELPLLPWSAVDFNRDGAVSAADYVVWRKTNGQVGSNLAADGNLDGRVNNADFLVWKANFGRLAYSGGAGSLASVPEPGAALLMISGALSSVSRFRRRRAGSPAIALLN